MEYQSILENLQNEASCFLQHSYLKINEVVIYPKEIEVYYYESGKFEDYSVHRNQLQGSIEHKVLCTQIWKSENKQICKG